MKGLRLASIAAAAIAPALVFAAPAHADPDMDFANELHTYGIYGQKDYNAWIGKITCKRLYNGTDLDADKSAKFVFLQLPKGSTTAAGMAVPRCGASHVLPREAAGPRSRRATVATVRRQKC